MEEISYTVVITYIVGKLRKKKKKKESEVT